MPRLTGLSSISVLKHINGSCRPGLCWLGLLRGLLYDFGRTTYQSH